MIGLESNQLAYKSIPEAHVYNYTIGGTGD